MEHQTLARVDAAVAQLDAASPPWLVPVPAHGAEAMAAAFTRLRDGGVDPREGLMLHPHPA